MTDAIAPSPSSVDQFDATIVYVNKTEEPQELSAFAIRMDVDPHRVVMTNGRSLPTPPSLDVHGFTLTHSPTSVTDFDDPEAVRGVYFEEIANHIKELTGAAKVLLYPGYVYREANLATDSAVRRLPAGQGAHIDFTDETAQAYLAHLTEGDDSLQRYSRIAVYQTWRALSGGRQNLPLAVTDGRSVKTEDLTLAISRIPPELGPVSEFTFHFGTYSPDHRWYYYQSMEPDDLMVFQGYDFNAPGELNVLHTAFIDETCPADVPQRRSLEVRTFAFFD